MLPLNTLDARPSDCFRVYAIASRAALHSALASNQVKELNSLEFGYLEVCDLVAVVSSSPQETNDCDLTADSLTAFSDRLSELHRAVDILPFRFTRPVSIIEIVSLLREHHGAYQENLRHVAGCTEVNARWARDKVSDFSNTSDSALAELDSVSGANYLRAKKHAAAIERASATELTRIALAIGSRTGMPCVDTRSSVRRIRTAEQSSILVYGLEVLVNRVDAERYLQVLSETLFRDCLPTIATGPWPPFSFVKDNNSAMVKAPFYGSATDEPVQNRAIFSGTEAAS